jgi:regulator of replication initiation timing
VSSKVFAVPESDAEKLARLEKENADLRATIASLRETISQLQEQLKQSIEGNTDLRAILVELQAKLDKLLDQKKKRDRKDHGPTTERHNPRPAAVQNELPKQRKQPINRNHIKHIHAQNFAHRACPAHGERCGARVPELPRRNDLLGTQNKLSARKVLAQRQTP